MSGDGFGAPAVPRPFARPSPAAASARIVEPPWPAPFVVPTVPAAPEAPNDGRGGGAPGWSRSPEVPGAAHEAAAAAAVLDSVAARLRAGTLRLAVGRVDPGRARALLAEVLVALHTKHPLSELSEGPAA